MSASLKSPIVVLGASGWIGHYVAPEIRKLCGNASSVVAAYRSRRPAFASKGIELVQSEDPAGLVEEWRPQVLVNLSRGETEKDLSTHQDLIDLQNRFSSQYVYASSFNAVTLMFHNPISKGIGQILNLTMESSKHAAKRSCCGDATGRRFLDFLQLTVGRLIAKLEPKNF